MSIVFILFFFFQAEDGIRDIGVTGVQTCALPISGVDGGDRMHPGGQCGGDKACLAGRVDGGRPEAGGPVEEGHEIGKGAWRGKGEISGVAVLFKKKTKTKKLTKED